MDTSFGFSLWNTSLAPPSVGKSAPPQHHTLVRETIAELLAGSAIDLIVLTEVRRVDLESLLPRDQRHLWQVVCDNSGNQHDSDVAILLRREEVAMRHHEYLIAFHEGAQVRCGLLLDLELAHGARLVAVAAHWRSDLGGRDQGAARRNVAAWTIKTAIGRALRSSFDHVLVLGDFNAEPYDDVFHTLPTSRHRRAVVNHRPRSADDVLLYNPSWRWLGETEPWTGTVVRSFAGTYCSKKSDPYSWRTFDQVMVSGSLLSTSGWHLREDLTRVYHPEAVANSDTGGLNQPFDHLPVIGQLRHRNSDT